jgi:hypothetical protein
MTDAHWSFILAAYAVTATVIGGMTLKILLDHRRLKQALGRMVGTTADRDEAA